MTTQQRTREAYERALDRAHRNGLAVVGDGHWRQGGARFLVVGSASEPSRFHLVTLYPGRLVCDCPARALCQHRALARDYLEREREQQLQVEVANLAVALDAQVAAIEADRERARDRRERERRSRERERERERREMALPAAYLAPARPFSLFKAS